MLKELEDIMLRTDAAFSINKDSSKLASFKIEKIEDLGVYLYKSFLIRLFLLRVNNARALY